MAYSRGRGGANPGRSWRRLRGGRSDQDRISRELCRQRDWRRHQGEPERWRASQHKHAMDHASDKTVLGGFNNATLDYYGVRSRFFRKDGKFPIETDGPDGKLGIFEIKYTFGIDPLQQCLMEFPDGRVQALSIAWDNRTKEQGGQRWFHLYADEEIKHDILHSSSIRTGISCARSATRPACAKITTARLSAAGES
jgi:hypothetical protein